MTTNMITAARLLAHKTINGKYQSLLQLDKFPVLGHQMVGAPCIGAMCHIVLTACLLDALDRQLHHRQCQFGLGPLQWS